jgi:nucleoside-diphosphate-sugar epimerase
VSKSAIIISGASGWLGKQLLTNYLLEQNLEVDLITAISSSKHQIQIQDKIVTTSQFSKEKINVDPELYYDFAFLTREKIINIGPKEYMEKNLQIIESSSNLIAKLRPKKVILASSGAIYSPKNRNQEDLYGKLKKLQEEKIHEICNKIGIDLIISRIFNLSGRGLDKTNTFAISNLIKAALTETTIVINSTVKTTRRYCDISEFLDLLVTLANSDYQGIFDSGGKKIEIRDLAQLVVKTLKSNSSILAPDLDSKIEPDNYFSNSNEYEKLLKLYKNKNLIPLKKQIEITAEYIKEKH